MTEQEYIDWWKMSKDEWDAMPDILEVRGYVFIKTVTKELIKDMRPLCEMFEEAMVRMRINTLDPGGSGGETRRTHRKRDQ